MAIDYSKIPHEDVTDTYFYVNLPLKFFHDRATGKITPLMFDCLAWIWEHAGYYTGRTKMTSAGRIQADLWPKKKGRPSVRSIQRALRSLHNCGYITLPKRFLHEESYSIRANNYVIYDDEKKMALYPKVTIGHRELKKGSEEAYYDDSCDQVQAGIGQSSGRVPAELGSSFDAGCDAHGRAATPSPAEGYSGTKDSCAVPSDGDGSHLGRSSDAALSEPCRSSDDNTTGESSPSGKIGEAGRAGTEQQQQLAAAVAFPREEQKPKTVETETESESKRLAQRFWEYLGSPAKISPSRWEPQFSELLETSPDLWSIMEYAFEKDSKGTWRDRLLGANTPVAYLRKVLPYIQEAYGKWLPQEAESAEKAAVLCWKDAVKNLLASGEVFVRDGHNYRFMAVPGHRPCYHEVDAQGNPVGIVGNLVMGLDLPLPEDALESAGIDV